MHRFRLTRGGCLSAKHCNLSPGVDIQAAMKTNHVLLVLLLLNLGIITVQIVKAQSNSLQNTEPVVRCRALELVDDQGRIRAELRIMPAQPNLKMPDGVVGYPETVLLRLINSHNMPHVKLSASEDGAGMVLGGDGGHVQILSRGEKAFVKAVDNGGREQVLKP
jgi:hypothetical protein